MKKIGRQVFFISTSENNPRNGEGAFIRLRDGGIMYAYTEYTGTSCDDHAEARVSAYFSYDEGESWENKTVLQNKNPEDMNIMSVSLMRMENDDIGLFFLRKEKGTEGINCRLNLVRSSDEGKSWSEPVCCVDKEGYFVTNNDRVIRLADGRIMFPGNLHKSQPDTHSGVESVCRECVFFVSEDDGRTWSEAGEREKCCYLESGTQSGFQESGLYQKPDGRIITWSRTDLGSQFFSHSDDGGKSWSVPMPSRFFTSAVSPMLIKDVGQYTVAVFNPTPEYTLRQNKEKSWGRTPYVCAVSTDKGESFNSVYYIEDDPDNGYCYPAIIECEGGFLLAYYHSNGSGVCLNSAKIVKIMYDELN